MLSMIPQCCVYPSCLFKYVFLFPSLGCPGVQWISLSVSLSVCLYSLCLGFLHGVVMGVIVCLSICHSVFILCLSVCLSVRNLWVSYIHVVDLRVIRLHLSVHLSVFSESVTFMGLSWGSLDSTSVSRWNLWSESLGPLVLIRTCPSSTEIVMVLLAAAANLRRTKFTPVTSQTRSQF